MFEISTKNCDWEVFTSYNRLAAQLATSRKGSNIFSRNLQQVNTRLVKISYSDLVS